MNEAQRKQVKERIITEIDRISNDIRSLEEITKPIGTEDMDEITRMDSIVNKSVNEAALASSRIRLAGLEYALKRIADQEFGYCSECGEPISLPRMLAMPESSHCIECAQ